jgi:hypothetical protein
MRVSFTVRKDDLAKMGTLSPVHHISIHKNRYKSWRTNRMYKSVRYTNPSYFLTSKIFAPANLFAILFFSLLIGFCINQKEQPTTPEARKQEKKLKMKQQLPVAYTQHGSVASYAPDNALDFLTDIPALELCFKVISF